MFNKKLKQSINRNNYQLIGNGYFNHSWKTEKGIIGTIKEEVDYLTQSDKHNILLFEQTDKRIKELEENLRLVYEYLGVHKEVINETCLVDDECCYDECHLDEEKLLEDVKPKKTKNK